MLYGDDYSTWEQENPKCGGCGQRVNEGDLVFKPAWNFVACPTCAIECDRIDREETGCTSKEILVGPTPVGKGFMAHVKDYEERYGTCYGSTAEKAHQAMVDWIAFVDEPKLPRVKAKPVQFAETQQGKLFNGEVA